MNKQFYRCFLILFRCKHPLSENGHLSLPSKTTVLQLRRACESSPIVAPPRSKPAAVHEDYTGPTASNKTEPPPPLPEIPS
ncbi:hypothetical protein LDENG_00201280 [Lucifuga dentata]|nr:hypothetical protein LDENG_00201280 [Lucifuga dentata]